MNLALLFKKIQTPNELMTFMDNHLTYGWKNINNQIILNSRHNYRDQLRISSVDECLNLKIASCIECVEIEREFFKNNNYEFKTYAILNNSKEGLRIHCFLIYEDNMHWHLFEQSWTQYKGIKEFLTIDDCLEYMIKNYSYFNNITSLNTINIIEYTFNPTNLTFMEFADRLHKDYKHKNTT